MTQIRKRPSSCLWSGSCSLSCTTLTKRRKPPIALDAVWPYFTLTIASYFLFSDSSKQQMMDISPHEDPSEKQDDSIQSAASSQRDFLSQLPRDKPQLTTGGGPRTHSDLMNDSIADDSGNNRILFSKQLSIGHDSFVLPNFDTDKKVDLDELVNDLLDDKNKQVKSSREEAPATRRRSTLGYLDYIFSKSNAPFQDSADDAEGESIDDSDYEKTSDSASIAIEPVDLNSIDALLAANSFDPVIVLKLRLASLDGAMEQSQRSQQSIHDWDRKMGLKRSHSKTMRLSTRSRKKLRQQVKREISAAQKGKRMLS